MIVFFFVFFLSFMLFQLFDACRSKTYSPEIVVADCIVKCANFHNMLDMSFDWTGAINYCINSNYTIKAAKRHSIIDIN